MNAKVFVDTNIWVYAKVILKDETKHKLAVDFFSNMKNQVVLSTQIINEFFNVLAKNNIDDNLIIQSINQIIGSAELSEVNLPVIKQSWELRRKYHYSIYDSLVLSSALEAGCSILFTEDLQHNQLIENSLQIKNPFVGQ